MKHKNGFIFLCFTLFTVSVYSQVTENSGWLFITHTQKLSERLEVLSDVQVRSANHLSHFKTLLLRGGLGYHFNKKNQVALGYAFKRDWTEEDAKEILTSENRVYEQYLFNTDIKKTQLTFRFRQEQRFIRDSGASNFSQRSRLLLGLQIPLVANADFSRGLYTTLQSELFLNVQHKEKVNNSFFDQNRPFISIGYRWSKKIDSEIGYMHWLRRETEGDINTQVYQLMINTSF